MYLLQKSKYISKVILKKPCNL